jgi:hypothetical protein
MSESKLKVNDVVIVTGGHYTAHASVATIIRETKTLWVVKYKSDNEDRFNKKTLSCSGAGLYSNKSMYKATDADIARVRRDDRLRSMHRTLNNTNFSKFDSVETEAIFEALQSARAMLIKRSKYD